MKEDKICKCGHPESIHNKKRCNHGRWGRGYACCCMGFEESADKTGGKGK